MTKSPRHWKPDLWLEAAGIVRGVILLTHGLNGSPASMDALGAELAGQGFAIFRPSFTGHAGDEREFLRVRADQWRDDALRFHGVARERAKGLGVPLLHVAYSMTALIFQALRDELPFDRRAYFAPALAFHGWYRPAMLLARALPWLTFGSRIPEAYRANARTGLRGALALRDFHRLFLSRHGGEPDSVPTLIWADPADELVHGAGLRRLAAGSRPWEFRELSTDGCTLPVRYHHLCLDLPSLGAVEWARVTEETGRFLRAADER